MDPRPRSTDKDDGDDDDEADEDVGEGDGDRHSIGLIVVLAGSSSLVTSVTDMAFFFLDGRPLLTGVCLIGTEDDGGGCGRVSSSTMSPSVSISMSDSSFPLPSRSWVILAFVENLEDGEDEDEDVDEADEAEWTGVRS